jgi:hypothetical protein
VVDDIPAELLPGSSPGLDSRGHGPSTPVGTTNTSILELDQVLTAGRGYRFTIVPNTFIPTNAATQYVMQLRATTDGSTPTNTSPVLRQAITPCSNAALNHMTPVMDYIPGNLAADTLYRLLITANVQAGTFQYQGSLELRIDDLGNWTSQQFGNNGQAFGTGPAAATVQNYRDLLPVAHTATTSTG